MYKLRGGHQCEFALVQKVGLYHSEPVLTGSDGQKCGLMGLDQAKTFLLHYGVQLMVQPSIPNQADAILLEPCAGAGAGASGCAGPSAGGGSGWVSLPDTVGQHGGAKPDGVPRRSTAVVLV